MYQDSERPSYHGQSLSYCALNRTVVAPEIPADHAPGGKHSVLARGSSRPKPGESYKTAFGEKGPPALPQRTCDPAWGHQLSSVPSSISMAVIDSLSYEV